MIKFRHLVFVAIISVLAYACGDNTSTTTFDDAAQAIIDKDTIAKFLDNHYFDDVVDSIKPLVTGKTPLSQDSRLKSENVTESDIDYTYYYLITKEGIPFPAKPSPTVVDSTFVTYSLDYFVNSTAINDVEETNAPIWLDSRAVIRGWVYMMTYLKSGENISIVGEPINFKNKGEGIFILPSGLAYKNSGQLGAANANLIYYIKLWDNTVDTDHDGDGIPSIKEDIDGDGNPINDDTDGDGLPNYVDNDDDNDGVLTIDEDRNNDGDPTNDKNGEDPSLPDYLNPGVQG